MLMLILEDPVVLPINKMRQTSMAIRKERVTIAKKVESAPINKIAIVDSIVEDDVDHLTPEQIDSIPTQFASIVASCSESHG